MIGIEWVLAAAIFTDGLTTQIGINQGAHEKNPFVPQNTWARAALLTGEAAGLGYLLHRASTHGHPRLAIAVGLDLTSIHLVATVINIRHTP